MKILLLILPNLIVLFLVSNVERRTPPGTKMVQNGSKMRILQRRDQIIHSQSERVLEFLFLDRFKEWYG